MAFLPKMSASALIVTATFLGLCCCAVHGTPNTGLFFYQCNPVTYKDSDPYRLSVDYILNDLLTVTANTPSYNLYVQSPYPSSFPQAYGHGQCNFFLSSSDCATCIAAAYNEISGLCNGKLGGKADLYDCRIRYENYYFTD